MLSLAAMKSGQGSYYLALAREDYYRNGGEKPGLWGGTGAADLGLSGKVEAERLTRLFEGMHPTEDRSLIQQQRYRNRENRPGWDLTFSASKSASVLWSQADPKTRRKIEQALLAAVSAALEYLEDEAAVTRTGKGGAEREPARLVAALIEHHTSRAQDAQLHVHTLIMNVCTDAAGKTRALESRPLFRAKMAAGAIFRSEFAVLLEETLHLPITREGSGFEIEGVSRPLMAEMSKRRAEINKALALSGATGAVAAARATLRTRQSKEYVAQEELTRLWQERGDALGWGPEQAAQLLETARPRDRNPHREMQAALAIAAERATEHQSYFSAQEFTRFLAEEAQGRGIGARQLRAARDTYLGESDDIVRLGRHKSELRYTTAAMLQEEKQLLKAVEQSKGVRLSGVSEPTIAGIISTRKHFSEEQAQALRHITEAGGSIRVVSGFAGTGKTTLLQAARLAWELEGYDVRGAALAGKAAEGLSQGAGIASDTLKRTLFDIQRGRIPLHARSIVVVDEAAMLGTTMMRELTEATQRVGAQLVLVGEAQQLQPIAAGGPFAEIERQLGAATLTEIKRQREGWAREAVKDFREGRASKALEAYAERGLLTIAEDRRAAMEALIAAWKEGGIRAPDEQLILAGTRKEAAILNRMAQEERHRAGMLSTEGIAIPDSNDALYVGDRLLFTKKSRIYGVENGSQGEVVQIEAQKRLLTVRLDGGDRVVFALDNYAHVRPAYAMSSHKGQGVTVERAYILAGGSMQDREITYVQGSRSRGETHLFTDIEEAGENLTRLVRQMTQSRQKEMVHSLPRVPAHRQDHAQGFDL